MKKEQDILKSLLLREELELLDKISQKVLSEDQFTEEVSQVLGNAVIRAQKKSGQLQRALSAPIRAGVKSAFTDNKQSIIDSLLPIMGKLIRKTVTNSIKQFVNDINRALELGFSSKAIKWRWQAYKAGITFPEMIFQKTVRYQVEEIFLINRENGLLIEHIGSDDMLKDNNAISAMLTAIQDFIGDSLKSSETDSLNSAEIANKQFIITYGPTAFLATVVKGSPTEKFKERLQQLIENIHADFSSDLSQEDQYRNIAGLSAYLKPNLVIKNITEGEKKINWWPWVIGVLLIISTLSYWTYQRKKEFDHITELTQSIQGLSVNSINRNGSGFLIEGLIDPLADTSQLNELNITLKTRPFISLDPGIIEKRVIAAISNFDGVQAMVSGDTVTLSGTLKQSQHTLLLSKAKAIVGINNIDDRLTIDNSEQIQRYLDNINTDDNIMAKVRYNSVQLSGSSNFEQSVQLKTSLSNQFPQLEINDSQLNIIDSTKQLISTINDLEINMIITKSQVIQNSSEFMLLIKNLQSLIKRGVKITLEIIGHSDCNGRLSDSFSMKRAEMIRGLLIAEGIEPTLLSTSITQCKQLDQQKQDALIKVTFNIQQ